MGPGAISPTVGPKRTKRGRKGNPLSASREVHLLLPLDIGAPGLRPHEPRPFLSLERLLGFHHHVSRFLTYISSHVSINIPSVLLP